MPVHEKWKRDGERDFRSLAFRLFISVTQELVSSIISDPSATGWCEH